MILPFTSTNPQESGAIKGSGADGLASECSAFVNFSTLRAYSRIVCWHPPHVPRKLRSHQVSNSTLGKHHALIKWAFQGIPAATCHACFAVLFDFDCLCSAFLSVCPFPILLQPVFYHPLYKRHGKRLVHWKLNRSFCILVFR